jgi:tRNA nucleotidyltransferase (CCA-adding enzyme)
MMRLLNKLPQEVQKLIRLAGDIALRNHMRAYLVGGFVRDLILGLENLDLDLAVEGNGIRFAEALAVHLQGKIIRHRQFGTATILTRRQLKIDVATARREIYPQPAHLPQVSPGTLKDDLFRRDFTINAMAIDISEAEFGALIDLFGGKKDLGAGKIRVLHDLSFIDDPTRILRAVRFEQRYDFHIEAQTLRLLKQAVKKRMLEKLQPQRLRDELILALKEKKPLKVIRRLKQLCGFSFISPRLLANARTYGFIASLEREVTWFKGAFAHRRRLDAWLIYLLGLLESLSRKETLLACKKFSFRRGEEKRLLSFKNTKKGFVLELSRKNIEPSRIHALLEPLSYEVILALKAKYKNPCLHKNITDFFSVYNATRLSIGGKDIGCLGIKPGPDYQRLMEKVLKAKLNGLVATKEEELNFLKRIAR